MQIAGRQQPEAGAPQQHVADRAGLLVANRERDLGEQVGQPRDDRLGQLRPLASDGQHIVCGVAVAARERGVSGVGDALDPRQLGHIDGRAERDLVRAARRVARLALDDPVDRHLGHPPPGRQLAPGDRHHPARRLVELGLARDVDRLLRIAGRDQRPDAGVGAREVIGLDRGAEVRVRRVEQVGDVLVARRDVVGCAEIALVVVVGRADQRAPEPRQGEDRAPAAGRHDRAAADKREILVADGDVGAAARADERHLGLVVELLRAQPIGPHAGRVDDVRRADDELVAAHGVADPDPGGAAVVIERAR